MSNQTDEIDRRILEVLARDGPLPTVELAERVGLDRHRVYRHCRRLAAARSLGESKGPSPRKLMFSPVLGEVVTRRNRDQVQEVLDGFQRVVWRHATKGRSLTEAQKAALRRDVEAKLRELGLPPARRAIVRRRLASALAECGGSHAMGALGSVPFAPVTCYWSPAPGDVVLGPPWPAPPASGAGKKTSS